MFTNESTIFSPILSDHSSCLIQASAGKPKSSACPEGFRGECAEAVSTVRSTPKAYPPLAEISVQVHPPMRIGHSQRTEISARGLAIQHVRSDFGVLFCRYHLSIPNEAASRTAGLFVHFSRSSNPAILWNPRWRDFLDEQKENGHFISRLFTRRRSNLSHHLPDASTRMIQQTFWGHLLTNHTTTQSRRLL
jgi:hypothetical protein